MEEILHSLHVNETFFFYLINFVLLVVILRLILWKPLIKAISQREERIDKGLKLTNDLEAKMQKIENDYQEKMQKASTEAKQIISDAKAQGDENIKKSVEASKVESAKLIESTKAQLAQEKKKIKDELMAETKDFVIEAVEKVIKEDIDPKTKEKIIGEFIKKI